MLHYPSKIKVFHNYFTSPIEHSTGKAIVKTPLSMQPIHDWMLALIVLSLVGIDVLIFGIFMAIEGAKGRLGAVTVQDRENPMNTEGVS